VFSDNLARSVRVGAWLRAADDESTCSRISNFTAIKSNEIGVFFMRVAAEFYADGLTLIDNDIGINLNPTVDDANDINNITGFHSNKKKVKLTFQMLCLLDPA
jgi:hypothetical protein